MLQKFSYEEILLHRIHGINPLMPHYYSELLLTAEQLLNDDEREKLHEMIFEVEKMVLETEMIPKEVGGKIVWVEVVRGRLSLYDIEMATESQPDYYAFFQKDDGTIITKFDIERELNRIKAWLYSRVREKSMGRRFQRFMVG
jgi:hypothetical protein